MAHQNQEAAASAGMPQSDIMLKKALIERKLEETGEKARLEEFLRQRLIESGWREDLKRHCLGKLSTQLSEYAQAKLKFHTFA